MNIGRRLLVCGLVLLLLASACSIDISQPASSTTPTRQDATAALPYGLAPKQKAGGQAPSDGKIAVTWGSLDLAGKLIYLVGRVNGVDLLVDVQSLDLVSGEVKTIFETPVDAWVDAAVASPDGKDLMLSYTPPVGTKFGGQDTLYIMPLDGSQPPKLLFTSPSDKDRYYQPAWSPDGKAVYFTHIDYAGSGSYEVMKISYPDGKPQKLAEGAYWPSVSPDGSRIAYVTVDAANKVNGLVVAQADGSDAYNLPLAGANTMKVIDAPLFLADDRTLLFSAPAPQPAVKLDWVDQWLGIGVASAHAAIPSDWWTVPVQGGAPVRITHLEAYSLFGSLSPSHQYVASFSSDSIFVMRPDGTDLTQLLGYVGGIPGSVSWIP